MASLGLVVQAPAIPEMSAPASPEVQLWMDEALASAGRLWVRGQLVGWSPPTFEADKKRRWCVRWRRKSSPSTPPTLLRLETRISGSIFQAEVPIQANGRFEATFTADLPIARRGWRIARNRVCWDRHTAEKCGIVVRPPDHARGIVVVVLPSSYTMQGHGAQRLVRSEAATRLTSVLRRLQQGPAGCHAFFYLAANGGAGAVHQAELALAQPRRLRGRY